MARHLLTLIFVVSLLTGCAQSRIEPSPLAPLPAEGFAVDWRSDGAFNNEQPARLHVSDDFVILETQANGVVGIARKTGTLAFAYHVTDEPDATLHPPVVLKDWIVYPTLNTLEVYSRAGDHLRTLPLRFALRSGAVGAGTVLYMGADVLTAGGLGRGHVVAVDTVPQPYSVMTKWSRTGKDTEGISSTPALFQGFVYVGTRDGFVYCMNAAEEGRAMWAGLESTDYGFKTGGQILADVKADNNGVYVPCTDTKLYCLDLNTGRLKWTYYAGAVLDENNTPVLAPDTIYMAVDGKGIVAIDNRIGSEAPVRKAKWEQPKAVQFLAQDDKHAYLLGKDGYILAADKATGQIKFKSSRHDYSVLGTNTKDATIYAAKADGQIVAIKPVTRPGSLGELALVEQPIHVAAR